MTVFSALFLVTVVVAWSSLGQLPQHVCLFTMPGTSGVVLAYAGRAVLAVSVATHDMRDFPLG